MKKFFLAGVFVIFGVLLHGGSAFGQQQIVTDPKLNETLLAFQNNFPKFVSEHPELTSGASEPINLSGGQKKATFTFQQQGQYSVTYGALQFSPSTPISANRFGMTLNLQTIALSGSSALEIKDKKGKTYNLSCANNQFRVSPVVFTCSVTVLPTGAPMVTSPNVKFDPKTITVSIPCLDGKNSTTETNLEISVEDLRAQGLWTEADDIALHNGIEDALTTTALQSGTPKPSTSSAAKEGLTSSAQSSSSDVSKSTTSTATSNGTSTAASAPQPCNGNLSADVQAVINDLTAISQQAQAQGFQQAMQNFVNSLKAILPTLSAPDQATVQKFINDLTTFTSSSSQGGTTITPLEQATLYTDFYNVVLSTGITVSQLQTLQANLVAVLNTLSGISTAQLQADFQKLVNDAKSCLKP
ncbi:MAG: hypothetical protein K1Y36_12440 [Blastocatellia bacterium]|nr:hypothetical protein [Blastocatellia bacterium]